jgi:hypothetical protein
LNFVIRQLNQRAYLDKWPIRTSPDQVARLGQDNQTKGLDADDREALAARLVR